MYLAEIHQKIYDLRKKINFFLIFPTLTYHSQATLQVPTMMLSEVVAYYVSTI